MSLEPAKTVERPVLGRVAAGSSGTARELPSYSRTLGWPGNSVPPAVLVELLSSARQALAGDGEEMRRFIAKAADLLNAGDENREASARAQTAVPTNLHLAPWQARRVIKFVEENLAARIRIEDLAEITRLSARQLSRAFCSDFGESPYAYIVRRRIARAKEMMLRTQEPLANIAAKSGFSDQPHLTRLFHRIVGESPASWRRGQRSAS
jgi:AraC family transcriptional regulator